MQLLPFGELPPYSPRRFVPAQLDWEAWSQIAPLFDQLESRAPECSTAADLERWLLDWSELTAALDEEGSRRYIAMTCHTDNIEAEKAYLHFVESIEPQVKPRRHQLSRLFLGHPLRAALPPERYEVLNRDLAVRVELFRLENVPLETEQAKLGQQYQKVTGSLTVQFHGEEKTLPQLGPYLEDPDRELRQEAWEATARRRLEEKDKFDGLFEELAGLRGQIARNAGYANYTNYAFRALGRFDYSPQDCLQFHESVEQEVMPVLRELQRQRRDQLKLPSLRPWDLSVDPLSRPRLRPFERAEQLVGHTQNVFNRLDPRLADGFKTLEGRSLLDLENRKGKAPGGYQATLSEARLPFIFMNAVGLQRDVETLFHEAGHAFHALATRPEDLIAYRSAPIEFCEVASMTMELLGNEFLDEFYSPDDVQRARRDHLEGIIELFPWVATVDAFQHWAYSHPGHDRKARCDAWMALMDRFAGDVDWKGYDEPRAYLWHRQLHIFLDPFYYIEYTIAQLGALQIWANAKENRPEAIESYCSALALGGSRPLPELFQAAGCRFDFTAQTIRPLMQRLRDEISAQTLA